LCDVKGLLRRGVARRRRRLSTVPISDERSVRSKHFLVNVGKDEGITREELMLEECVICAFYSCLQHPRQHPKRTKSEKWRFARLLREDLYRYKTEVSDLCHRTAEVGTLVRIPKSRVLARVLRFFLRVLSNDFECLT
jgi:hypothetical protein